MQKKKLKKGGWRSEKWGCNSKLHIWQNWVPLVKGEEVNFFFPTNKLFHVKQKGETNTIFKFFENSNSHQISQTKIPFWLDFHGDHESKLRFHSECLYRDKSEHQVLTQKNKTKKKVN